MRRAPPLRRPQPRIPSRNWVRYNPNRYDRNWVRRGYATRVHYDRSWYRSWRYAPGPRWYPGSAGVWIEVVYARSPYRYYSGARSIRCSVLADELAYAHDEWHWRNDAYQWEPWYEAEHAQLQWGLETEWRRSGCGHSPIYYGSCYARDWGVVRTAAKVIVALEILDILFDGSWHR